MRKLVVGTLALLCAMTVCLPDAAAVTRKAQKHAKAKLRPQAKAAPLVKARFTAKAAPRVDAIPARHRAQSQRSGADSGELDLKSNVVLVLDNATGRTVVSKNVNDVQPIASITKLMTAMVVLDSRQALDSRIAISDDDVDTERGSRSRLKVGAELSRGELLHLALMSSENRAAHALGRSHPGGMPAFVTAMNEKARELGMERSRFVEPTGLSSANVSSAADLARLVRAAHEVDLIRRYSTDQAYQVNIFGRELRFHNTNRLVAAEGWDIGLSKTGFIQEAGRCLVMYARVDGRSLTFVLLDSWGKLSRVADANRIRKWLTSAAQAARPD